MLGLLHFVRKHPYPILLLGFPWFLLALNPNWPFANGGNCDPWFYYGHFRSYPDLFLRHPCYDGERLPAILPGRFLHLVFTPVLAQVLLHVGFFYVAVFSLYSILRHTHEQRTAILTAALLGSHAFFLGPMGWDYGDGFCIAYYLLALAFLTRALRAPRPYLWISLAGATSAALVYSYPLWLMYLPFFPVYYIVSTWRSRRHTLLWGHVVFTPCYLLGLVAMTLSLALMSYIAVGTFHFYKWSIATMRVLETRPEWYNGDFQWVPTATWIVFPVITLLGSVAYLLKNRPRSAESPGVPTLLFLGNFLCGFLVLSYLTFIKGRRLLELDYYASSLLAPMFLALGSTFLRVPERIRLWAFLPALAVAVMVCVYPLWKQCWYPAMFMNFQWVQAHVSVLNYYLLLPCALGACGLLLRAFFPKALSTWAIGLGSLCLAGFGLVPAYTRAPWIESYHGPAMYSRVTHVLDTLAMQPDAKTPRFFWFSLAEKCTLDYLAINRSLREHGAAYFTFPALTSGAAIPPESVVLIFTENKDIPKAAEDTLRQVGLTGKLVSQVRIARDDGSYWITFLRTARADSSPPAPGQPLSKAF